MSLLLALILSQYSGLPVAGGSATATATTGAVTLFVDPTGNDANRCTASGTAACLTLGGALNKLPINIRDLVTVNVAAGTYTEVFRVLDFNIEGRNGATASTAALNITGVESAFTVATGSNAGTLTAYSAGSAGTHGIATDSGQTWTVNDLRGRFLQIVSGTGSGQFMPIASNTATAISLASNFTTPPVAGSTYAIVTPGPVFTATAGNVVRSITGSGVGTGAVTISDISLQASAGNGLGAAYVSQLNLTRVRAVGSIAGWTSAPTGAPGNSPGPTSFSFNQTYFQGGSGNGLAFQQGSRGSLTNAMVFCSACAGSGIALLSGAILTGVTGTISGSYSAAMLQIVSGQFLVSGGLWLDCAAANPGILIPVITANNAYSTGSGWAGSTGPFINGCSIGFSLNNPSVSVINSSTIFTSVTTAISLASGARAVVIASPTFTGVTTQISIDGEAFTDANLTTYTTITSAKGSQATR